MVGPVRGGERTGAPLKACIGAFVGGRLTFREGAAAS